MSIGMIYLRIAFPALVIMILNYILFCWEGEILDEWKYKWSEILHYICIGIIMIPPIIRCLYIVIKFIYF